MRQTKKTHEDELADAMVKAFEERMKKRQRIEMEQYFIIGLSAMLGGVIGNFFNVGLLSLEEKIGIPLNNYGVFKGYVVVIFVCLILIALLVIKTKDRHLLKTFYISAVFY